MSGGYERAARIALLAGLIASLSLAGAASASALGWQSIHVVASGVAATTCDPAGDLCAASDVAGSVATSTEPLGGAAAWHAARVDPPREAKVGANEIFGISCPSASLCVASDFGGDILTSTNPTGGDSAWTLTKVHTSFYDVACASTSLCVALGADNTVWTSTEPSNPATWSGSGVQLATYPTVLRSIACAPGGSLCAIVGEVAGEPVGVASTTTNPAAGSGSWSAPAQIGTEEVNDVTCPSSSLCLADTTGVIASTDPTNASSWSVTAAPKGSPYGLACARTRLCYAHDFRGNVYTSGEPLHGSWLSTHVDELITERLPSRMACASQGSVCLFGDEGGNLLVSATGQAISGTITDPGGNPLAGVAVQITGSDAEGAVSVRLTSDASGGYSANLQPGTYTVAPQQPPSPVSEGTYVSTQCAAALQAGACPIVLNASEAATVDFKLVKLVVDSAGIGDDPVASLAAGLCDTTPSASSQSCTLPAAIELTNQLGGGAISFDIPGPGVPLIEAPMTGMPAIGGSTTIDGTTQPGGGFVEVAFRGQCKFTSVPTSGLEVTGGGSTIRGMAVNGFGQDIHIAGVGHDTVQGDRAGSDASGTSFNAANILCGAGGSAESGGIVISGGGGSQIGGTGAGQGNLVSAGAGAGIVSYASFENVIQGNSIGSKLGSLELLSDAQQDALVSNDGGRNTIGGATPGAGNTLNGRTVEIGDIGDTIEGNRFLHIQAHVTGSNNTIGGSTGKPGSGAGNEFFDNTFALLTVARTGNVVQGNLFRGFYTNAVILEGAERTTVGGADPGLGNLFEEVPAHGNPRNPGAAIAIGGTMREGGPVDSSSRNLVAGNQIRDAGADGGVAVYAGTGDTISENQITSGQGIGINLGGGDFRYNELNSKAGPNDFERYPNVLGSTGGATVKATLRIDDGLGGLHRRFTIELYSQASCAHDSSLAGEGAHFLGRASVVADGFGAGEGAVASARALAEGDKALTATATGEDGSTSEFSPCLTIGRQALAFVRAGVQVQDSRVDLTAPPPAKKDAVANGAHESRASSKPRQQRKRASRGRPLTGVVHVLCPPRTERFCAGTLTLLTTHGKGRRLASATFKLAPGQLAALPLRISAKTAKLLGSSRRLKARLAVLAHDGARHRHVKRASRSLVLSAK